VSLDSSLHREILISQIIDFASRVSRE